MPRAGIGKTLGSLWALKENGGASGPSGPVLLEMLAWMFGINMVPAKSTWLLGQKAPKHMAAGLEKTALMASWGEAMPTPPMAREMGPTPIRLSPLVARALIGIIMPTIHSTKIPIPLTMSTSLDFLISPYPGRVIFFYHTLVGYA